jgi:hypothetical protein
VFTARFRPCAFGNVEDRVGGLDLLFRVMPGFQSAKPKLPLRVITTHIRSRLIAAWEALT